WGPKHDLDAQERGVLSVLVCHADKDTGESYPGIGHICSASGVSRSKVIRSLAKLESRGLFRREQRSRGGGFASNHYHLPLAPPGSISEELVSGPTKGLTSVSQTPPVVSPRHLG